MPSITDKDSLYNKIVLNELSVKCSFLIAQSSKQLQKKPIKKHLSSAKKL